MINLRFTPERLKGIRECLGLTQTEMAERCHVTQPAVSQWEAGETTPSTPEALEALLLLEAGMPPQN